MMLLELCVGIYKELGFYMVVQDGKYVTIGKEKKKDIKNPPAATDGKAYSHTNYINSISQNGNVV